MRIGALSSDAERAKTRSSRSSGFASRVARDRLPCAARVETLHDGIERTRLRPFPGHDRLAVEVDVEEDRLRARRASERREHERTPRGIREQLRAEPAPFECAPDEFRVALDVGRLVRDVRDREQFEELAEIFLHGAGDPVVRCARIRERRQNTGKQQRDPLFSHRESSGARHAMTIPSKKIRLARGKKLRASCCANAPRAPRRMAYGLHPAMRNSTWQLSHDPQSDSRGARSIRSEAPSAHARASR
jgi:hypothetical protein